MKLREICVVTFACGVGVVIFLTPTLLSYALAANDIEVRGSLGSAFLTPMAVAIPILIMISLLSPTPIDGGPDKTRKRRPPKAADMFWTSQISQNC